MRTYNFKFVLLTLYRTIETTSKSVKRVRISLNAHSVNEKKYICFTYNYVQIQI